MYMAVSRDGFIAGNYDDTSRVSPVEQQQYARMINWVGNMIVGRRTYEVMQANHEFDQLQNPFVVIMTNYTYKNEEHRHFTNAKPKNIVKYLIERGRSSTVVAWWAQINKLFLEAGLVDQLFLDEEPVDVKEWLKLTDMMPPNMSLELIREYEYSPGHIQRQYKVFVCRPR